MKYDKEVILIMFQKDNILQKIAELLSFIKIAAKYKVKNYIVDIKICTRKTLDIKLKKLKEMELIEINKNIIIAKRRLLELYGNSIRTQNRNYSDIIYKTNALLLVYTLADGCINTIYKNKDLQQRRIYQVNNNLILSRIYCESNTSFNNRLKYILQYKGYNDNNVYVYVPLEYKQIYIKIMEQYEDFGFKFIFY